MIRLRPYKACDAEHIVKLINGFQIRSEGFSVFIRDIFQRVSYLVYNTALVFRLWKSCCDRFFDSG